MMTTTDTPGVRRLASPPAVVDPGDSGGDPPETSAPTTARRWPASQFLPPILIVVTVALIIGGWRCAGAGVQGWPNALYALAYVTGGYGGGKAALSALRKRRIHPDLLLLLAALGAAAVGVPFEGAVLLLLFSLSRALQTFAMDRTRDPLRSLSNLGVGHALTQRGLETMLLPTEQVAPGDVIVVRAGEIIALDGVILEGESAIDESILTGESEPVPKAVGQTVLAGSVNRTGMLAVRVTDVAGNATLAVAIRRLEDARSEKTPLQRFCERTQPAYLAAVLVATALLVIIPRLISGHALDASLYRALTFMVVVSRGALFLSTRPTILAAIGGAARRGILFHGETALERTARVRLVAIEKTGILTIGAPHVTDVLIETERYPFASTTAPAAMELLRVAAAVESRSPHPVARAIVDGALARRLGIPSATAFQSTTGEGVSAFVGGRMIGVGNLAFFRSLRTDGLELAVTRMSALQDKGKTCVLVGEILPLEHTARILGAIAVANVIRADAPLVIRRLRQLGIAKIVMLTGDSHPVAATLGREAGIADVYADLRPDDKVKALRAVQRAGTVAMVGHLVDDAAALAAADVGMAMGAAGMLSTNRRADVVLMSDRLSNIARAVNIARRARRFVMQHLLFAFGVMLVMAAATLLGHVSLIAAGIACEGTLVAVCFNALRLLLPPREPGDAA